MQKQTQEGEKKMSFVKTASKVAKNERLKDSSTASEMAQKGFLPEASLKTYVL